MIFYYNSTQTGAPVLSGAPGALKTLLQTCLVTGFGAGSATGITVASGVATVSFSGAHPYIVDGPIAVAGATPAALNGNKTVTAITTNSVQFAAPGVPDGAATGTITTKVPGAGWQEMFAGTANLLVLKPTAVEATGMLLRVDDTGTTNARVRAYESMSEGNTGVGPSPLDAQVNGGGWWPKSNASGSAARPWFLVADARGFHLFIDVQANGRCTSMWAGDVASLRSGDAYSYLLTCNTSDQTSVSTPPDACNGYSRRSARDGAYLQRAYTAVGGAIAALRTGAAHNGSTADVWSGLTGYAAGGDAYPNGPTNGLLTCPVELSGLLGIRGTLPGLHHARANLQEAFVSGQVIDGTDDMLGRRLMALRVGAPAATTQRGTVFVDLTGPWVR